MQRINVVISMQYMIVDIRVKEIGRDLLHHVVN